MKENLAFVELIGFYVQRIGARFGLLEAQVLFNKAAEGGPLVDCKLGDAGFNNDDKTTAQRLAAAEAKSSTAELTSLTLNLYQNYADLLGEAVSGRDLESAVTQTTQKLNSQIPPLLIRSLPLGVMENEKTKLLSREELETLVKQRTQALQEAKNNLEKIVEKRTALLKAERNKLRSIVDSISDAVIVTDRQKRVVLFNGVAGRLLGLSEKESLDQPVAQLLKLSDEKKPIDVSSYCPIVEVSEDKVLFSQKGLKAQVGPRTIYLDVDSSVIVEGKQADIGCIITLHDVSREKELEIMKLDFVSLAAHELRTPLTSIRGYLEVFLEENRQMFNAEQALFLDRIRISTQQLSALVDNLLNASRIEQGTLNVHFVSLNWGELVGQMVDGLKETARAKGIELKFNEAKKEYPLLTADKIRAGEVLDNLLTNALNYTPRGGQVLVSIEKEAGGLVTKVTDNGDGISPEALKNLFTKFFRVQNRLEETPQGLGLGLYLSKAIVDLHKGRIWAESQLGQGSTFSFFLPFTQPRTDGDELKVRV